MLYLVLQPNNKPQYGSSICITEKDSKTTTKCGSAMSPFVKRSGLKGVHVTNCFIRALSFMILAHLTSSQSCAVIPIATHRLVPVAKATRTSKIVG